ncbi:hypothetical protein FA15DRAFT_230908 [Coprinopsis marcescibilis]|uniref:GST N-terminal domain-containing protein n=1 Tax=Coprinopsis marcescibilis TaxID=230819 RepID=A0A5C3KGI8_COPMA|nr:hypothetical protein FA15DRAFT_230908 [Coprinopsis marcescibilis]
MDASKPIVFYDIMSGTEPYCTFAPNPCKIRYALNFKRVHYKTEWVDLPDVPSVREKLGLAANRTHWDGSPFHTLPAIKDLSTGETIGDSFDIALYLDKQGPGAGQLFPPATIGLTKAFNKYVDALFTNNVVILCLHGMPMNPATAEQTKATFLWRTQKKSWEEFDIAPEDRVKALESFKTVLGEFAITYSVGVDKSTGGGGPFLDGRAIPTYADLIVGGWLGYMSASLPGQEWDEVKTWHDGLWGRIYEALEKYAEIK